MSQKAKTFGDVIPGQSSEADLLRDYLSEELVDTPTDWTVSMPTVVMMLTEQRCTFLGVENFNSLDKCTKSDLTRSEPNYDQTQENIAALDCYSKNDNQYKNNSSISIPMDEEMMKKYTWQKKWQEIVFRGRNSILFIMNCVSCISNITF